VTIGLLATVVAGALGGVGLLVLRSDRQTAPPALSRDVVSSLWSVPVGGGRPQLVLRDPGWQDSFLVYRRDGTILFERPTALGTTALYSLVPGGRPQRLRNLTMFTALAYSAARDELAVLHGREIVAETVSGRTTAVLAHVGRLGSSSPAWSADASTVAFSRQVHTASNPYQEELVIVRGGHERRFRLAGSAAPLALSPHGDRLAFAWGMSLYLLDVETGRKHLLANRGSYLAAWSPDGRSVAFDDSHGLVALDLVSGRRRLLAARGAAGAAFAPDSRSVLYVTLAVKPTR
jgi:WD40-like Beta Propeller Repeat